MKDRLILRAWHVAYRLEALAQLVVTRDLRNYRLDMEYADWRLCVMLRLLDVEQGRGW